MDERGEEEWWGEATSMKPYKRDRGGEGGRMMASLKSYSRVKEEEAYMISYV